METQRQLRGEAVIRGVQEHIGRAPFFDPTGDLSTHGIRNGSLASSSGWPINRTWGNRVNAAGRGGTLGFFAWACSTAAEVDVQLNRARGSRQIRSTPRSRSRRLSIRSASPLAKNSG